MKCTKGDLHGCRYKYPSREFKEKKNKSGVTKRMCSFEKLTPFMKFLAYSVSEDAVYCAACRLFTVDPSHGTAPTYLCKEGFYDWKHLNEKVKSHSQTIYHQHAAVSILSSKGVVFHINIIAIFQQFLNSLLGQTFLLRYLPVYELI